GRPHTPNGDRTPSRRFVPTSPFQGEESSARAAFFEEFRMLSRTAENLYWLARYVERAEYLARTIDATLRVTALPAAYIGKTNEWDSALLTAGVSASFYQSYKEANEQNVVEYLAFNPSNSSSIKNCI